MGSIGYTARLYYSFFQILLLQVGFNYILAGNIIQFSVKDFSISMDGKALHLITIQKAIDIVQGNNAGQLLCPEGIFFTVIAADSDL